MHIRKYSLCVIVVFQTSQDLFKMKLPINIYLQGNDHLLLIDIQNCITSTQSDLHCFWRHSILCSAWTEPMTFAASTMLLSYRNHTYRDLPSYISRDLHLNQLIKIFFFLDRCNNIIHLKPLLGTAGCETGSENACWHRKPWTWNTCHAFCG